MQGKNYLLSLNSLYLKLTIVIFLANSWSSVGCQVYWPLDADWYSGRIVGYHPDTNQHHV